jgi:hypothetical protein
MALRRFPRCSIGATSETGTAWAEPQGWIHWPDKMAFIGHCCGIHQNHPIFSISDVLNANHRICHVPWEHVKSDCHQAWILLQTLTSEESEGDSEDMKFIYNINIKTDMEVS